MEEKTGLEALGLTNIWEQDGLMTTAKRLRDQGELTELQQKILDHWAMFPDLTYREISEDVKCTRSYAYRVIDRKGSIYYK